MTLLSITQLKSAIAGPFDLSLERGECLTIVGRSGAGKSVFLRLLADLDVGSGAVELEGRQRDSWTGPQWRRQVVYQPAEPAWWADSVVQHFDADQLDRVATVSASLDLPSGLLTADVTRLSSGERQRFALVRSLARDPKVLLLDEPSASLDAASTHRMEQLLETRLADGLAVIMVTHSQEQAQRMGHRRFEMIDHRLVAR